MSIFALASPPGTLEKNLQGKKKIDKAKSQSVSIKKYSKII